MTELVFIVTQDAQGTYSARARGTTIVTGGATIAKLRENVRDALNGRYEEGTAPPYRLQLI